MTQQQIPLDQVGPVQTLVIASRGDFDQLFAGFRDMKAVSYVASAESVLRFLDDYGYEHVELLVGEGLDTGKLKAELTGRPPEALERLARAVESRRLRILTPKRPTHSKFYLLGRENQVRVVVGSANLSETARQAVRQVNYVCYFDLARDDPALVQFQADYERHCRDADEFMGDLVELLRKHPEMTRPEVIGLWLGTAPEDDGTHGAREVLQALGSELFAHVGQEQQPVINLTIPNQAVAHGQAIRALRGLIEVPKGVTSVALAPAQALRWYEETQRLPMLRVDVPSASVHLGFRGAFRRVDKDLPPQGELREALDHMERYINTVDLGHTQDPQFAKTSMFEALLYVLAAPFAHEEMKERRRTYGAVDRRGPRFLYIYGPAQNGKSTFLRFAGKLLTGAIVEPIKGSELTITRVRAAESIGFSYPLLFDDVPIASTPVFERIAKSHWETDWRQDRPVPQLAFTSNTLSLREWAKSRMKRVDFDVHFVASTSNRQHLDTVLRAPNELFGWFARMYLRQIGQSGWLEDDELGPARKVMRGLYRHAARDVPEFFSERPLEELYDPDHRAWRQIVNQLKKATVQGGKEQTIIEFSSDMQPTDIREYESALPQTVKYKRHGRTLVIDNPVEFHVWFDGGTARNGRRWLQNLLRLR